jgi:hypothetical protein
LGGAGLAIGVAAWSGRYRSWLDASWYFGRSLTFLIPAGAGLFVGGPTIIARAHAANGLASALGTVALGLMVLGMLTYFIQPRWTIPPWVRRKLWPNDP